MDIVHLQLVEDLRVVRDDETGIVRRVELRHALGHDLHRIHIEPGVRLIEERKLRCEHQQLQDLAALLLTAREADIQIALCIAWVDLQLRHHRIQLLAKRHELHTLARNHLTRRADHILHRDPRNLLRRLEREEKTAPRTLERAQLGNILPLEDETAARHLILRMSHNDIHQR